MIESSRVYRAEPMYPEDLQAVAMELGDNLFVSQKALEEFGPVYTLDDQELHRYDMAKRVRSEDLYEYFKFTRNYGNVYGVLGWLQMSEDEKLHHQSKNRLTLEGLPTSSGETFQISAPLNDLAGRFRNSYSFIEFIADGLGNNLTEEPESDVSSKIRTVEEIIAMKFVMDAQRRNSQLDLLSKTAKQVVRLCQDRMSIINNINISSHILEIKILPEGPAIFARRMRNNRLQTFVIYLSDTHDDHIEPHAQK